MTSRRLVVGPDAAGERLDRFLTDHLPELSRTRVRRLIDEDQVRLNDRPARPAAQLEAGDLVVVAMPAPVEPTALVAAPDLPLVVLHADAAIVVVDKPAGQVVHPAAGHTDDTLVNALLGRFPELAEVFEGDRPGIVHRLDRDTSGVMVVARTPGAAESLKGQFQARGVEKKYLALVKGRLSPPEGSIEAPIGRDPERRKRMAAMPGGRPADTGYRVIDQTEAYSWLEASPRTGRTHQLRVHFAAVGHPVAGDPVYGRRDRQVGRLALHAWRLAFDHPLSGERVSYEAPLPEALEAAVREVGIRL